MKTMLKTSVGVTFILLLFGCQLTRGPSDEALISELADTIVEIMEELEALDIDRLMSLFSESFSGAQGETKQAMREGITMAINSGAVDNLAMSMDEAKIAIEADGTATVSSVRFTTPAGDSMQTWHLVKEKDSWLISSIATDPAP